MNAHETNGSAPRLRLLGLVPLDFQAPAVQRTDAPLAVGSGDAPWFRANLPCVAACPLATDVPRYVALVAQGQFRQAAAVVEAANLFPEILCLVCPRPCEPACRRGLIDAPVAIRQLKRAAVDFGQRPTGDVGPVGPPTGRRVAIVGSGPAGMAAARTLRGWGHAVTVYEAEALGGTLTSAIPAFRLPRTVIDTQWQRLQEAGVEVRVPVRVGADMPLEVLLAEYDAVLLSAGCQQPVWLNLPGADLPGVYTGLDFMKDLGRGATPPVGERVVVIGAGLVGLDCARSAVRLGARSVVVIELLPEHRLPYDPDERTVARDEGITFVFERRVTRITGHEAVAGLETEADHRAGDGQTGGAHQRWPADAVIIAVGQRAMLPRLGGAELAIPRDAPQGSPYQPAGWPAALFAAGDALSGPSSVAEAIASGRRAATAIHTSLMGASPPIWEDGDTAIPLWTVETPARRAWGGDDYDRLPRQTAVCDEITDDGSEHLADGGYSSAVAQREAQRCLQCQLNVMLDATDCILCGRCIDSCPYGCLLLVGRESLASIDGDPDAPALEAAWSWPDGAALVLDETACIRCGLCVGRCPNGCLSLEPLVDRPVPLGSEQLIGATAGSRQARIVS